MKAFVTGADGFIGSHLVESLAREGNQVTALAQYNSFGFKGWLSSIDPKLLSEISVVYGDLRDYQFIEESMRGSDIVFHLGALIAIPYSYRAPSSYIDTNVIGTLNVLNAALKTSTQVVHTSTSEVYGTAQTVPITEDHRLKAQSPYAASKIAADQLVLSYVDSFGLPALVVRPFNTYGPRQSARAVIPAIIAQILSGAPTIKLGAVSPTRDFNFVRDTVSGFLRASRFVEQYSGEVFNLGSSFEISIEATVKLIQSVMGVSIPVTTESARMRPEASEVERLLACNIKAKECLGWEPQFGGSFGLKRGLELTVEWFSDPKNLRLYDGLGYAI